MSLPISQTAAHWHILGFGAIGQLIAKLLINEGCEVTALLKGDLPLSSTMLDVASTYCEPLSCSFTDLQQNTEQYNISSTQVSALNSDMPTIHNVVICTKAHQGLAAFTSIINALAPHCNILILMNGLGVHEDILSLLNKHQRSANIYLASSTHGVLRIAAMHTKHTGQGGIQYGYWRSSSIDTSIITSLTDIQALSNFCHYRENIEHTLWEKLVINCAINALTVKYDCLNGELLNNHDAWQECMALTKEAGVIACKANNLVELNTYEKHYKQRVTSVIKKTAKNSSSMREDIKAGRSTEIDYINGYLVKAAKVLGLDAEKNAKMHRYIKSLPPLNSAATYSH